MTNEEIDKLAQGAFEAPDVAFEAKYWEAMEAKLDKPPKKRGIIFWWGSGFSLLVLLGIGFLYGYNSLLNTSDVVAAYSPRVNMPQMVEPTQDLPLLAVKSVNESGSNVDHSNPQNTSRIEAEELPVSDGFNESNYGINSDHGSQSNIEAFKSKKSNSTIKNKSKDIAKVNMLVASEEKGGGEAIQKALPINSANIQAKEEVSKAGKMANSLEEDESFSERNNTKTQINEETNQKSAINKIAELANSAQPVAEELNSKPIYMPLKQALLSFPMQNEEIDNSSFSKSPVPTTEFDNKPTKYTWSKWIEVYADANSYGKNKTMVQNTQSALLTVDAGKINEWTFGAKAGLQKNNWIIYSGISFTQLQQQFKAQLLTTSKNEIINIEDKTVLSSVSQIFEGYTINKVPNGNGFSLELGEANYSYDTTYKTIQDTTVTWNYTNSKKETTNTFTLQYAQIPIGAGYNYIINQKWLVEGYLQANLGFLLNSKGYRLANSSDALLENREITSASSFTLGYNLGVGAGYFITHKLSVRLRPQFGQIIVGPYPDNNFNRSAFGLNGGLRYSF